MIGERIIHVGIGSTGESIIRNAFQEYFITPGRLHIINADAHQPLIFARTLSDAPSFTFVRNPWDWRISYWKTELLTHDWANTFRAWFYERDQRISSFTRQWHYFTDPGIDYVGKFETFAEDLIRILPQIIPDIITEEEIKSWFPRIYKHAAGYYPWMSGVEQWMRDELFDYDMMYQVYEEDAELIERFGYTFDQKYDFVKTREPIPTSFLQVSRGADYTEAIEITEEIDNDTGEQSTSSI